MKFIVTQTANYFDDEIPPIENCKKEEVIRISRGTWKTIEAAKMDKGKGWFFREGSFNHRELDDGVAHDRKDTAWVIELDSLLELTNFIKENGQIVMWLSDYLPEIEIYKGYRE